MKAATQSQMRSAKVHSGILCRLEDVLFVVMALAIFIYNYQFEGLGTLVTNVLIVVFIAVEWLAMLTDRSTILDQGLGYYFVFLAVSVVSYFYSEAQEDSFRKIITMLMLFALLVSLYRYVAANDKLDLFIWTLVLCGVCNSIYLLLKSEWMFGARVSSITGDSNQVGSYIAYTFAALIYLWQTKKMSPFIFLVCAVCIGLATLSSGSRTSFILVLMALLLLPLMLTQISQASIWKKVRLFILMLTACAALIYITFHNETMYMILGRRIQSFFEILSGKASSMNESSTYTRILLWKSAWHGFLQKPIWGHGIASFNQYWGLRTGNSIFSHNNYLELLFGVGLLGTIPYYAVYGRTLRSNFSAWKRNKSPYAALALVILVQMAVSHFSIVFYYQKLEVLFVGLLMGIARKYRDDGMRMANECALEAHVRDMEISIRGKDGK